MFRLCDVKYFYILYKQPHWKFFSYFLYEMEIKSAYPTDRFQRREGPLEKGTDHLCEDPRERSARDRDVWWRHPPPPQPVSLTRGRVQPQVWRPCWLRLRQTLEEQRFATWSYCGQTGHMDNTVQCVININILILLWLLRLLLRVLGEHRTPRPKAITMLTKMVLPWPLLHPSTTFHKNWAGSLSLILLTGRKTDKQSTIHIT